MTAGRVCKVIGEGMCGDVGKVWEVKGGKVWGVTGESMCGDGGKI